MQGKLESYPTMSMNISLTLLVPLLWHCYPSIVKINCSNVFDFVTPHFYTSTNLRVLTMVTMLTSLPCKSRSKTVRICHFLTTIKDRI